MANTAEDTTTHDNKILTAFPGKTGTIKTEGGD